MTIRITMAAALIAMALTGCANQSTSKANFDQFANDWWQRVSNVQDVPSDSLPDVSEQALARAQEKRLALMAELQKTDTSGLTEQQKINFDILRYRLQNDIDEYRFGAHYIPLTAEGGFHSDLLFAFSSDKVRKPAEFATYLKKLAQVSRYMDQQMSWMQRGLQKGYSQPKAVLVGYEQSIAAFIKKDIQDSPFYRPFLTKPDEVTAEEFAHYQAQARQLIADQVQPAYQRYYDFFTQTYVPQARDNIAAESLPDGKAYYQNRLEYYTTLQMTPQQVHQLGLNEVKRIRSEMDKVIQQTGFKGNFAEFIQFLRTDKRFYVQTPEQLLKEASYISKKIDAKLPKLFNTLPRTPYGVEPVPAQIAPKYTTGRYSGSGKAGEAGYYWVNTYALERRPLYELEALTLHEAVPGHHLQISLAAEQTSLPDYRRDFYTSAFGEGWGLYSEYLGLEVGFYQDPYSNFGRLTYEMWRACRLVVDTGMHTMGWSRQQAIDFLASNTALSMHNVTTEVDRYISWPAQALAYKLGELTIKRLRDKARNALGEQFDVREFHDKVLENGALPLSVLEQQVDKYIEAKRKH